jgi:hypothetical protein
VRDIRQDLRERIAELEAQVEEFAVKIADLEGHLEVLRTLLHEEGQRWPPEGEFLTGPTEPVIKDLAELIQDIMSDHDEWSGKAITAVIQKRGYRFGEHRSPGRSVHFKLIGMQKQQIVENTGKGKWRLRTDPSVKQMDSGEEWAETA